MRRIQGDAHRWEREKKKAQKNVGRFRILKPVWRNNGPFLLHSIEHLCDDGEKEANPAQREANELE